MTVASRLASHYKQRKIAIKPSRRGLFTKKAKAAGMSVQAYAAHVLANKDKHPAELVEQANFARNFGGKK